MLKLDFVLPKDRPFKILCLGAHSDDIEIGCGGTILKLISGKRAMDITWIVLGAWGARGREAKKSAEIFLSGARKNKIIVKGFKDSYFPYMGDKIKDYFEEIKKKTSPDLIFTHYRHDLHQDHRLVSELTWNTFRDHLILEYEIIKYDGDLGIPNVFSHLSTQQAQKKIKIILNHFRTQKNRGWFVEESFNAIMSIRGVESNAPGKLAEGFYCRKMILGDFIRKGEGGP